MRRILTILVLATVLLVALSVTAFAGNSNTPNCSDPPNAWGQNTALYAQWYQDQHDLPYGWIDVRWTAWYKWFYPDRYDNRGQYVAEQKAAL